MGITRVVVRIAPPQRWDLNSREIFHHPISCHPIFLPSYLFAILSFCDPIGANGVAKRFDATCLWRRLGTVMMPPEIASQHCPIPQFYLADVESGRMMTNADQTSTGKTQWQLSSPDGFWYDQDQHEWVLVLQGAARLSIEEESKELKPGDYINIPAHIKHRVEWTTPDEPTVSWQKNLNLKSLCL